MVRALTAFLAFAFSTAPVFSEEPLLDHQPIVCSLPGKNPRACAYVADDGEVKKVRAYFRAEGTEFFYWSEMVFDGIQYCATLPVAKKNVKGVEYYLWAIDDSFQSKRTRSYKMSLVPEAPCEYPVFDDDAERSSNLVVNATSSKQGSSISDFIDKGIVRYIPVGQKK
jgi:hypothetical protein